MNHEGWYAIRQRNQPIIICAIQQVKYTDIIWGQEKKFFAEPSLLIVWVEAWNSSKIYEKILKGKDCWISWRNDDTHDS